MPIPAKLKNAGHVLTYDKDGRLVERFGRVVGYSELRVFRYEAGRLVSQEVYESDSPTVKPPRAFERMDYEYDPRGYLLRITRKSMREAVEIKVTYDDACRVVEVDGQRYQYTDGQRRAGETYDERGRVIAISIGRFHQYYDPVQKRTVRGAEIPHTYGYDDAGRLATDDRNGEQRLKYDSNDGLLEWTYNGQKQALSGYCPLTLCTTPDRIGDTNFYPCIDWGAGDAPQAYQWPFGSSSM